MQLQVPTTIDAPTREVSASAGPSRLERLMPVWGTVLAAVVAVFGLMSLRWGIVHDASLMFYIGREVLAGAKSVTGVLDLNLPLVHWLHAGIYWLIGTNDLAWRLMDVAMIGGIVAEFFGTRVAGMGFRMQTGFGSMSLDLVWAEIAVAAVTGSLLYGLLVFLERRVTFWHPSYRS